MGAANRSNDRKVSPVVRSAARSAHRQVELGQTIPDRTLVAPSASPRRNVDVYADDIMSESEAAPLGEQLFNNFHYMKADKAEKRSEQEAIATFAVRTRCMERAIVAVNLAEAKQCASDLVMEQAGARRRQWAVRTRLLVERQHHTAQQRKKQLEDLRGHLDALGAAAHHQEEGERTERRAHIAEQADLRRLMKAAHDRLDSLQHDPRVLSCQDSPTTYAGALRACWELAEHVAPSVAVAPVESRTEASPSRAPKAPLPPLKQAEGERVRPPRPPQRQQQPLPPPLNLGSLKGKADSGSQYFPVAKGNEPWRSKLAPLSARGPSEADDWIKKLSTAVPRTAR